MMEHLDEGILQAFLDGELGSPEADAARRHVAACEECRDRFSELRASGDEFRTALVLLDRPASRRDASPTRFTPPALRGRGSWWGSPAFRAAAMVLIFVAGASAAVPGSPVRGWVAERLAGPGSGPAIATRGGEEESFTLAAEVLPPVDEAGVSVEPAGGRLRILVTGPDPDLQIRAQLTDGAYGGAFYRGAGESARFRTALGTIEVIAAGEGELRLEIPRGAAHATVEVDGVVYLSKEGGQLRLSVPAVGGGEAEMVFRARP